MYPIMFLAPLFLENFMAGDRRAAFRLFGAGVATLVLVNLPFAVINWAGWIATYTFHSQRTANFDSIWYLGVPQWTPGELNLATGVLTLATGLIVLAVGWVQGRKRGGLFPAVQVSAAMLATFLLWNKVHSPQYTLWLLPFFVLLRVNVLWWVAYAIADAAVYFGIFRWFFEQFADGTAKDVLVFGVWARAALLLVLIAVFLRARSISGPPDTTSEDRAPEPADSPPLLGAVAPSA